MQGVLRNPLRALVRYVLPLAVGGGLAAGLAVLVTDSDSRAFRSRTTRTSSRPTAR